MFYFFLLIQKFHKLLKIFFFIMHIRFSSIIKSCKTIIFQLPCDFFPCLWKHCYTLEIEDVTKLLHEPVLIISPTIRLKNTCVDLIHFILSIFHSISELWKTLLSHKKHCYNNNAEGKMDPSLTPGAAVEREGESRRLQGPDTPSTWRHQPRDWLMFHACAGFINWMWWTLFFPILQ